MQVLTSVHSLTLTLSRALQSVNQDLGEVVVLADAARNILVSRRELAEENFKTIFQAALVICDEYDIEIRKPRLARTNLQLSIEEYYRIAIYIPYLDLFITHLQDRFLKHRDILSNFTCLFPDKTEDFDIESCCKLFKTYESILHDSLPAIWTSEAQLWSKRIAGMKIKNSLEALDICNIDAFPNVYQILRILAVLPVTTAGNERTFSTLRRLKTYLRSTMSEDRLNGLAALNIHRNLEVDVELVLKEFFSIPRRVALLKDY